jgi:ArsR family transcriptional regulator, arsenate/arsenite/antimonite-responsive transcriptional repressor
LTIHLEPCIYISMKLEKASAQLEALGHPVRLRIFRLLVRAGLDGLPVGAVQDKLDMPASTLSHHIRKLIDTGLVTQERHGTTLISRASYPAMQSLLTYLTEECCADASSPSSVCVPRAAKETAKAQP